MHQRQRLAQNRFALQSLDRGFGVPHPLA